MVNGDRKSQGGLLMPIYKEVDELLNAMDTWDKFGDSFGLFRLNKSNEKDYVPYVRYEDMVQAVTGAPHADVAPVVHAHKCIATSKSGLTMFFECSNCRKAIDYSDVYCKYCGAKMDGEVESYKEVGKRMADGFAKGFENNVRSVGQQFCNGEE